MLELIIGWILGLMLGVSLTGLALDPPIGKRSK